MREVVLGTFGFGYNLDSLLLRDIADEGNGAYSFIPDVGFVGTVFIHAASNVLAVCGKNATVTVKAPAGAHPLSQENVVGSKQVRVEDGILTFPLGSIAFGQSRDVCLRVPCANWSALEVAMEYTDACSGEVLSHATVVDELASGPDSIFQAYRLLSEKALKEAAAAECIQSAAAQLVATVVEDVQKSPCKGEPALAALLEDLQGQGSEAVSRQDWRDRWGRHYLRSLSCAHALQQCNNFKDPGVQRYGGEIFSDLRDEADEQFSRLPPPESTRVVAPQAAAGVYGGRAGAAASPPRRQAAPASMARYNCASAPCFAGGCAVATPTGLQTIGTLERGSLVLTPSGKSVKVSCVVVSRCHRGTAFFSEFPEGLRITPYHPVRSNGLWMFPQDLHPVYEAPCSYVYNLVVEDEHIVLVNGVECVTLGHGFTDSAVIQHDYLGTHKVVDDLRRCEGWASGRVFVERMVRGGEKKNVCGLVEAVPIDEQAVTASTTGATTREPTMQAAVCIPTAH